MLQTTVKGFQLSPQQQNLSKQISNIEKNIYSCYGTILITGNIYPNRLKEFLQKIINKHEILRTNFVLFEKFTFPLQIINNYQIDWLIEEDFTTKNQDNKLIETIWQQFIQLPFDLENSLLFHAGLITLSAQKHLLLIGLPSLCGDRVTLNNILQEIGQNYTANEPIENEPLQYADFAQWQHDILQSEETEIGREYWQKLKLERLELLQLPYEQNNVSLVNFNPQIISSTIASDLLEKVNYLAIQYDTSIEIILLTCWQILLKRLIDRPEITIGVTHDGRKYEELKQALGLYQQSLPIQINLENDRNFNILLAEIQQKVNDIKLFQECFTWKEIINNNPQLSENDFLPFLFEFQPTLTTYTEEIINLAFEHQYIYLEPFKIKLSCYLENNNLITQLHYDSNLYQAKTIQILLKQFHQLVKNALNHPTDLISQLEILTPQDYQQIIKQFNQTQVTFPPYNSIQELFAQQVILNPDKIALICQQEKISYQQLNTRANQLAHYLQKLGIVTETLVGLYIDRSPEMLIGILGILKAGATYIPLDPSYPSARIAFMLEDTSTPIVLSQSHLIDKLPSSQSQIICLDSDWQIIAEENSENPVNQSNADNLAYIIYTSGSTGNPKGVQITHRNLFNSTLARIDYYPNSPQNFLLLSSFAFDSSIAGIFWTISQGGTLHLPPEGLQKEVRQLADLIKQQQISHLLSLPSLYSVLLEIAKPEQLNSLNTVIVAGETCPIELVKVHLNSLPDSNLYNEYGPTEGTVWSSVYHCQNAKIGTSIPIGKPIANTQIYILDQDLKPVPFGVVGEIYISGAGVAKGYLNQPKLTAERFIPPLSFTKKKSRLYKTGDLARYLPDGNIEFIGRIDHQVKIRGFRIELGEIEAKLNEHPAIIQNIVIVREDIPADKRLVAYIISNKSLNITELKQFLAAKLPDYMIPNAIAIVTEFPLTPNGKIDRQALPIPEQIQSQKELINPRTDTEKTLAKIWQEVLAIEQISIDDNFFNLGGHSLQAIKLISQISTTINLDLSAQDLFSYPTIAKLADLCDRLLLESLTKTEKINPQANNILLNSSSLEIERRSLLSLFNIGKIAPVDAVALSYIDLTLADLRARNWNQEQVIKHWCDNLPVIMGITETNWGRIAGIMLPRFIFELYEDQKSLVRQIIEALEIAKRIGAKTVSLTGLIPSATDYGKAIIEAINDRNDLPIITTGHATTSATVVLAIKRICEVGKCNLSQEKVGFIGLGSVGSNSLRLMLKSLPHPQEIILCDVYQKLDLLLEIQQECIQDLEFSGTITLALSKTEVPSDIYRARLIVGATNVPNVLDINKVKPGTLIVDDSAPHCFSPELAIKRFEEHKDILFTEGGVLKSPYSINRLRYFPEYLEQHLTSEEKAEFLQDDPYEIMGCGFSSLLCAKFNDLTPTIGNFDWQLSLKYYQKLSELGFQAADLHCGKYVLKNLD